jgi:phosphate transport system ATP-binding protein
MIDVKNLHFSYEARSILKDITLHFEDKKIYTLIGASGSGKSTFLRVFNRMDALHAHQNIHGEVRVDGEDILSKKVNMQALRAKVGMVFQKPTPFALSIFDNIAFALKLHRRLSRTELQSEVERLLREVGLFDEVRDQLKRSAFALSGGQQQRLCFARTLATQPKVLLLDEPTSSLDPASTQKIEALIDRLRQHYLIIMVTHNLAQAKRLADEILFMQEGRILPITEPAAQNYLNFSQ